MSQVDPYQSPSFPVTPASESVDFGRMLGFVRESPNWLVNVMWSAVCILLGSLVVGQMVLYGYQMEIIESRQRNGSRGYSDFDMNRIGDYLLRGLWVWLALLVASIPIGILAGMTAIPMMITMAALGNNDGAVGIVGFFAFVAFIVFVMALSLIVYAFIIPIMLKVGLTGNFGEALDLQWHLDFIRRTLGQMILGFLFLMIASFVFSCIGMLLCFVGIFPAMGWFAMTQAEYFSQLYSIYLQRGGKPILVPARV